MNMHIRKASVAIGLILALTSACKGGSLQKPLPTSPVAAGPNTMEFVRKQLEGTWTLTSLVVHNEKGASATPQVTGTLTWDAFGNLKIEYRLSDAGVKALEAIGVHPPTPVITTDGRAVINTQDKAIQYVPPDAVSRPFDPKLSAARDNPFALERLRYYVFAADGTLTLSTRHDNGKDAAVSKWKKGA
jgi:hypothetical protein